LTSFSIQKHNLDLTDREKKIILVKFIIHGVSPFQELSIDKRVKMLVQAIIKSGLKYNDMELQEIGRACISVQEGVTNYLMTFLKNDPDLLKTVERNIKSGSDEVEKNIFDEVSRKLGLK